MNLSDLLTPFPLEEIKWRVGATNLDKSGKPKWGDKPMGLPLAYIDARAVMDRLDEVCGPENWQARYPKDGYCEIGIFINEWVWKGNGAGETDFEGIKGQYSDAFKRAAVMWGVGRYLYHLTSDWVPLDNRGRIVSTPKLPNWADPNHTPRVPKKIVDKVIEQSLDCLHRGDEHGLREIWGEFSNDEKVYLWRHFNSAQRGTMKEFLG